VRHAQLLVAAGDGDAAAVVLAETCESAHHGGSTSATAWGARVQLATTSAGAAAVSDARERERERERESEPGGLTREVERPLPSSQPPMRSRS
jgi:hypothetical protein